jgi:antirestriction protein ArdC
MVGHQLGIGHDPGQHGAYVKSWVKVLREDPKEILRAARDADKIAHYVLELDKERAPAAREAEVIEAQRPELVQPAASERQRLGTDGRRAAGGRER